MKLNCKKVFVATTLLLLLSSCFAAAISTASAHTPSWDIPTYSFISASPNPVGVNQQVALVMWLDKVPPTAGGVHGDRWVDMTIEVTKPDNSKETLGPFTSDTVASAYTTYIPDQTGTYTFKFMFPGQVLTGSTGTGIFGTPSDYINDTYLASEATTTLVVQQTQVTPIEDYVSPTEYWTRPIDGQNTNWYQIASNWLGSPQIEGKFQPDGIAPNSPHIMWTKSVQDGGIVGGQSTSAVNGVTFYDGTAYEGRVSAPIIMNGRLYYDLPRSDLVTRPGRATTYPDGGFMCVDLRTGEELYWQNITFPSVGQLYNYDSMNQHGVIPNGYLWSTVGTTWHAYDSLTGNWIFSLTDVPAGTNVYGPNGELLRCVINMNGRWMALWNNTAAQALTGATNPTDVTSTNYNQWRPVGKTVNASTAYSWNVSIPALPAGSSVKTVILDDVVVGSVGTGTYSRLSSDPFTMWAISLKPESRGQLLWMKNYSMPTGNLTRSLEIVDGASRVIVMHDKETRQWLGYSLDTGDLLWGPTASEEAWNYYAWAGTVADGNLITSGYGIVYCYNVETGDLLWNFSAPGGLDVPYTNYPLTVGAIADGKVYLGIVEHSSNSPYWKGGEVFCVDINTGEKIWEIASHSASTSGGNGAISTSFAIADGYLVYLDLYRMQIVSIGKGPSQTTVTAPNTEIALGSKVLIQGKVTDIASGTKQNEQIARFPDGVPVVSDASMGVWMEYVYMQKPKPADITGVTVKLTAIDSTGHEQDIGSATTDIFGKYALAWAPTTQGTYRIVANFESTDSYWGSQDATYATVGAAASQPQETSTPNPTQTTMPTQTSEPTSPITSPSSVADPSTDITTETLLIIGAAVVIIAVIGAAAVLLRKRA